MPDELRPADGEAIEYKAFARHFEHRDDDETRAAVVYVVATLSKPDTGWRFMMVEQEGDPEVWRLFEDDPGHRDGDRTYYVACGSSEKEVDNVPRSVNVIDAEGPHRVSVVPWD